MKQVRSKVLFFQDISKYYWEHFRSEEERIRRQKTKLTMGLKSLAKMVIFHSFWSILDNIGYFLFRTVFARLVCVVWEIRKAHTSRPSSLKLPNTNSCRKTGVVSGVEIGEGEIPETSQKVENYLKKSLKVEKETSNSALKPVPIC